MLMCSGLLIALMVGDKSGITPSQWDILNRTGTTHLMVISGLHIGLMASLGFWLTLWVGRLGGLPLVRLPLPFIASVVSLVFALFLCGTGRVFHTGSTCTGDGWSGSVRPFAGYQAQAGDVVPAGHGVGSVD